MISYNLSEWRALRISVRITMLAILLLSCIGAAVTAPLEEWNRTYGGIKTDYFTSLQKTSDGGYILVEYTTGDWFTENIHNTTLIKTDSSGYELWNTTFVGLESEVGNTVQQTSDGGYVFVATRTFVYSPFLPPDVYLIKTDSSGNLLWNKTYGGINSEDLFALQQTSDGGYILAGVTGSFGTDGSSAWLIKTDSSGNELWNRTLGGPSIGSFLSLQTTSDGGYILVSIKNNDGVHDNTSLVKTDSFGYEQWNRTFGGINMDRSWFVQQTSDDGYILGGTTNSYGAGNLDGWIVKTDSSGYELWNRTFGGANADGFRSIQQTSDNGYIISGSTNSFGTGSTNAWLLKTDSSGNELWNGTFGGADSEIFFSVQTISDSEFVLAGYTTSYGAGSNDGWLVKISSNTIDNIPPDTTIVLSGRLGSNNWYVSNVDINLTAEDNEGGSGLNKTEYSLDNATWTTYNSNFTISTEGITIVYYRSRDIAGNIEETRNHTISIDKTKPSITINAPYGEYVLGEQILANWQAIDLGSGIAIVTATAPNGTVIDTSTVGQKNFNINASDNAGNEDNKTVTYNILEYYSGTLHLINGTVMDNASKTGISDVSVYINATISNKTNATGFYSLAVTEGEFNLMAKLEPMYYENNTVTVSTFGRAIVVRDIELTKKPIGNVTGSVTST